MKISERNWLGSAGGRVELAATSIDDTASPLTEPCVKISLTRLFRTIFPSCGQCGSLVDSREPAIECGTSVPATYDYPVHPLAPQGFPLFQRYYGCIRLPVTHLRLLAVFGLAAAYHSHMELTGSPKFLWYPFDIMPWTSTPRAPTDTFRCVSADIVFPLNSQGQPL